MRVWKTTLTFNAHEAFLVQCDAEKLAKGDPWGTLTYDEQFRLLQQAAGRRLTLVLKRLRTTGVRYRNEGDDEDRHTGPLKFRYIAVGEFHKSGVVHFHCIMHELGTPIPKRAWAAAWPYGFSKFKLVPAGRENDAIRYATKYLAKDNAARIRASVRYGVGETLNEAFGAPREAVALSAPVSLSNAYSLEKRNRPDPQLWDPLFGQHLNEMWPVNVRAVAPDVRASVDAREGVRGSHPPLAYGVGLRRSRIEGVDWAGLSEASAGSIPDG